MEFGVLFDVTVSLLAVVLVFSVAASAINEFIADNLLNLRGAMLAKAVGKLLASRTADAASPPAAAASKGPLAALSDRLTAAARAIRPETAEAKREREWADRFFEQADVARLMNLGRRPSAIEPRRYAVAALRMLGERETLQTEAKDEIGRLREAALALVGPSAGGATEAEIRKAIERIAEGGATFIDKLDLRVDMLEREFNEMMDRVSGWYVRRTKIALFFIGLVLAVGANVDFLDYAKRTMSDAAARANAAAFVQILGEEKFRTAVEAALREDGGPTPVGPPVAEAAALAAPTDKARLMEAAAEEGNAPLASPAVATPATVPSAPAPSGADAQESLANRLTLLSDTLAGFDARAGWSCRPGLTEGMGAWGCDGSSGYGLSVSQMLGWAIVALSVTLGAQFWYDLFQRLVRLRTAGITGGAAVKAAERPAV